MAFWVNALLKATFTSGGESKTENQKQAVTSKTLRR